MRKRTVTDLMEIAGGASITTGAALASPPAGLVVGGCLLIVFSVLAAGR